MAKLGGSWATATMIALVLALAGCGGGSHSTTSSSGTTAPGPSASAETSKQSTKETTTSSTSGEESAKRPGKAKGSGEAAAGEPQTSPAPEAQKYEDPQESLETFGSNAEGEARDAVVAALHTYLGDIATGRFKHICEKLLTEGNREQLEAYLKSTAKAPQDCPEMLASLLKKQGKAARAAAAGAIQRVRIEGKNAIVVFTPRGGPRSYFAMTEESGSWRVISLTTGTPIDPLAH
jgi:hypothetical protein